MRYLISIIIPVYNVEPYIREALESIIRQSIGFEHLEVIMVNDGSTDRSGMIMDEYAGKYDNVISIHLAESSGAAGGPRNIGLERATGQYIMFLDPDDFYTEDACEILYRKITETQSDIIVASFEYCHSSGKREQPDFFWKYIKEDTDIYSLEEMPDLLTLPPSIWAKIFDRKLIQENHIVFPEKIVAQDMVFMIHCILAAKKISIINNVVCNYRVRDGEDKSISYRLTKNYFLGVNRAQFKAYEIFRSYGKEEYYPFLYKISLEYYLNKFLASQLSFDERKAILKEMHWFFRKNAEYQIPLKNKYLHIILEKIIQEKWDEAIGIAEGLKELSHRIDELEKGKQWLEVQLGNYQAEVQRLEGIIAELKDWIGQLEKSKSWLEKQLLVYQRLKKILHGFKTFKNFMKAK